MRSSELRSPEPARASENGVPTGLVTRDVVMVSVAVFLPVAVLAEFGVTVAVAVPITVTVGL